MITRYCPACGEQMDMRCYQTSTYLSGSHCTEQVRWWATCKKCGTELDVKERKEEKI